MINEVQNSYAIQFKNFFKIPVSNKDYNLLFGFGKNLIDEIYKYGILPISLEHSGTSLFF